MPSRQPTLPRSGRRPGRRLVPPHPDHAVDLAWRLGLKARWLLDDHNGGVSGIVLQQQARRAIESGDASTIVLLAGDRLLREEFAVLVATYNRATREHLAPIPIDGPNSLFALLTQRHMVATGLRPEDYGRLVIAQRAWATLNPLAIYRTPLDLETYLAAPIVATPLRLYDCPPVVSGADALVLTYGRAPGVPHRRASVAPAGWTRRRAELRPDCVSLDESYGTRRRQSRSDRSRPRLGLRRLPEPWCSSTSRPRTCVSGRPFSAAPGPLVESSAGRSTRPEANSRQDRPKSAVSSMAWSRQ